MYSRLLLNDLNKWRNNPEHKPLVLRGARQVGKTTLINEFSKQFNNYIYLNLELSNDASVFQNYSNVEEVINYLFLSRHISRKQSGQTLLFIDEIQ